MRTWRTQSYDTMCILKTDGSKIIQEFSTLTIDIESMRDLMKEHGVEVVGMESTGAYWIPIGLILFRPRNISIGVKPNKL